MAKRHLGSPRWRGILSPSIVFIVITLLAFANLATWSLTDPLVSAPDEQSHIITAVARDHFSVATPTAGNKVTVTVTVPASIAYTTVYPDCWHFYTQIPATCSQPFPTSQTPTLITTYTDHYPPLYYTLVGVASWFSETTGGIYAMRLISSLLGALMLGLAAYAIAKWSRRRGLWLGVVASLTPLTWFLSSSVNPSGFEIMTAICFWTLIAIWGLDHPDEVPRRLATWVGVVASVFVLIRGLSPLWVGLGALSLLTLVGPVRLFRQVRESRHLQIVAGSVFLLTLVATAWIITQGTLNILPVGAPVTKNASLLTILHDVLGTVQFWIRESVGVLGWVDTTLPHEVYLAWYFVIPLILVVALLRGQWNQRIVVAALAGLAVAIPVTLVTLHARQLGVVWQGRDSMPLAVGAVIMASAVATPVVTRAKHVVQLAEVAMTGGLIALFSWENALSFYTNLRRYAVGRDGPATFFLHHLGWSPPIGQVGSLVLDVLFTGAFAGVIIVWLWFTQPKSRSHSSPRLR
ncbi:MAG: DUF2142 domain-containing protein [Acidimicrobiaceae bacterium]|nr:DUF2142 domain-containing protein [Acidimicrobiaceae bacterium]